MQNNSHIRTIENGFGGKEEDITPWANRYKGTHHHRNTFLGALSENPRFSG